MHKILEVKGYQFEGENYVKWEDYDRIVCDMAMCKVIVEQFVLNGIEMGGMLPDTEEANSCYERFENIAQKYKKMFQSDFGRKEHP